MNNKKPLNVLSIDFDFFQTADADTMNFYYPDGIDLPPEITTVTWSGHYYGISGEHVRKVTCPESDVHTLYKLIQQNKQDVIACEAYCSHVHIYDMICEHYATKRYDKINLINIDMHPDVSNENKHLDCGNWISHLKQVHPNTKLQWITRQTMVDLLELNNMHLSLHTDFEILKDFKPNLIFLCRSDTWFPPHLDMYFDEFLKQLQQLFPDCFYAESCIQTPRNFQIIQAQIDQFEMFQKSHFKTGGKKL